MWHTMQQYPLQNTLFEKSCEGEGFKKKVKMFTLRFEYLCRIINQPFTIPVARWETVDYDRIPE